MAFSYFAGRGAFLLIGGMGAMAWGKWVAFSIEKIIWLPLIFDHGNVHVS